MHAQPKPKWMVSPKKRGIKGEDKVGLEAEKKRTKLDHPPPTSVSPSTKVEEVQEKGAVQNHPSWRVKRVHKSEEMEEGKEVQEKVEEQEKVEVQEQEGGVKRVMRVQRKPQIFPSQEKRTKFKQELDECVSRCHLEAARTGTDHTAELVAIYAMKVQVYELGW